MKQEKASSSSSPGVSMVEVRDCIEELISHTLHSQIHGTSQIDLHFPTQFCSLLLSETSCPLYKPLASALLDFMESTQSYATHLHTEDGSEIKNHEVPNESMLENWLELKNILKTVDFEIHVQEPFFTQLRDGFKTVEGRCAVGDYNRIGLGSLILVNKCLLLEVQEVQRYASFFEMLEAETLEKVLPGVKTIEEGVQIYRNFYSEEKERYNGVLGIHVMKPALQLCIPLARVLAEMRCEGLRRLLGPTPCTS